MLIKWVLCLHASVTEREGFVSHWIKNPTNQVHRAANGQFYALWQGQVVYRSSGAVRHFDTEAEAWSFLGQSDRAGRMLAMS